jgi:hypothetical protein
MGFGNSRGRGGLRAARGGGGGGGGEGRCEKTVVNCWQLDLAGDVRSSPVVRSEGLRRSL